MPAPPRGVAVLDVGSTNTRLHLFDASLTLVAEESKPSRHAQGPPYRSIDPGPVLAFAARHLPRFDRLLPIDAVVVSAHGSSLALLDAEGHLALPVMAYTAEPPADIATAYTRIEPPFAEVGAPTNPGALTLGRQLLWQETLHPDAFARVRTILPYGQYIAHRLGGRPASEITALGAQTHLIDIRSGDFSALAKSRDWATRFAPVTPAWAQIGTLTPGFRGAAFRGTGRVHTGIHDSSANFLRYAGTIPGRFTLLSTGTWIIGFDTGADITALNPAHDLVTNTRIDGAPIAACRFMGGAEFAAIARDAPPSAATLAGTAPLISAGTMALPSFTDSGGPAPGTGGIGRILGAADTDAERASLAALYCAQMTALSLQHLQGPTPSPRIIVDGPFAQNPVYLACLAALLPGSTVETSNLTNGTAAGAALLALADNTGAIPSLPVELTPVPPAHLPGLAAYHQTWRARARSHKEPSP